MSASTSERCIRAPWIRPRLDLGYVVFEPGDQFLEYYYSDRWYAVFAIHTADGLLKGWYCNIARPAHFSPDSISSDDLDLDLFVSPDHQTILRLDVDEFESRNLASSDPTTYHAAHAALDALERAAQESRGERWWQKAAAQPMP